MGDTALRNDMQALLEQSGWVRALARRLASGADADDLEQATWLAALTTRSERSGPLREWLGAIVRNFARQQRRSEGRRTDHEQRAARREATGPADDLLARAELQRKLVGAVMELEEPYRTTVLLRYFENLPPREIAARLDTPLATVRTRLARAIERLRERFDAEHGGDRGAWVGAFAPLWPRWTAPGTSLGAVLVVNAKIVTACVVLAAAGAVAWWWNGQAATSAHVAEEATFEPARPASRGASGSSTPSEPASTDRSAIAAGGSSRETSGAESNSIAAQAASSLSLRGSVIDAEGRPLAKARIVARPNDRAAGEEEASALSDASGAFVFEAAPATGLLASGSRDFATVLEPRFGAGSREGVVVVLAPRLDFAGVVVDESGAPIENAELKLELPEDFRSRFDVVLDRSATQHWSAVSAADGSFQLDDTAQVVGAMLEARADGFETLRMAAPQFADLALRVVLRKPRATDGYVRGEVVDAFDAPVAGAYVAFGLETLRTPPDGSFAFKIDDAASFNRRVGARAHKLVALARGWRPVEYEPPLESGKSDWPAFVRLKLADETLSLSGRVVDASDEPMAGVRVFVADATLFGAVNGRPAVVETLFVDGDSPWKFVETDRDGRFVLDGLLDRDYVVRAHDSATLLRTDSEPTRAGRSGLELRIPTGSVFPLVAGRVLSLGGQPIVGASIYPMCDAFRITHDGQPITTSHDGVEGTRTGEDGRFELRNVPLNLVYLRVDGETILPVEYGRYVEGDRRFANTKVRELPRDKITELEIRVEARCHMQVELASRDFADELAVLDAQGAEIAISLYEAGSRRDTERHPLHDGRSAVLSVPESGRTLVLFKDGQDVARQPIELDASKPITVRR